MATKPSIVDDVAGYYSARLAQYGQTPRGVDWNGPDSQGLRFEQLGRVIESRDGYSLNDLGCGYGAMLEYLEGVSGKFTYAGYDISEAMVQAARERHAARANATFTVAAHPLTPADYTVASGIFNVRLGHDDAAWRAYLEEVLAGMDRASVRGFAFNCLTSYSDADRMKPELFYADPCAVFDLCKRRFSKQVALLHDYGLYEFTILVRKAP